MSETIYATTIKKIGASAADFLKENMLIFFQEDIPPYLADYCYLIDTGKGSFDIQVGDQLVFDSVCCPITAIGDVALENFKTLGHLTVRFDGADTAAQPGSMHVRQQNIPPITVGMDIRIIRNG